MKQNGGKDIKTRRKKIGVIEDTRERSNIYYSEYHKEKKGGRGQMKQYLKKIMSYHFPKPLRHCISDPEPLQAPSNKIMKKT